ncbi:MAG: asparagine synthase (glutamine-hydrolyzing) [Candidatus Hydrogenedentes bacterium]|nr:asparagine synthase (glutamine-hydrolyzing) [Candidatus Hydrogenedentota bacterium]
MCGIAGIAGAVDEALIRRMTGTLAHRGPDDEGFHLGEGVSLGHRRLSIIDIEGGHQPMASADGSLWLVYNGEIYNYPELKKDLEAQGRIFATHCDTEVILHAYALHGDACAQQFQGMFAFALWDAPRRRLFLARDPLGVKPLYYALAGSRLYFASEMKALLCVDEISRALDLEALDDYLTYLYTVPPRTMFQGIRQLPPGHYATWEDGRWSVQRYWRLKVGGEEHTEEEWLEEVRRALAATVQKYMLSDVPLGAYLSGGLDSATIVSHMRDSGPVQTFTVGFTGEGNLYDETGEAAAMARHLDTEHHLLRVQADVTELLPRIVRHFDEPFGNPTALLAYAIAELVRKHVKVVLSGDGGDESFGGYPRYAGVALAERYRKLPRQLRAAVINPLVQLLPESTRGAHGFRRLREFSAGTLLDPVDMYASWISYYSAPEKAALYGPEVSKALAGRDALGYVRHLAREAGTEDPISQAMYVDLHSFLPNNVLHYGDRMSMAHGLETRVPLADPKLVELLACVPGSLQVQGLRTKRLLRRAMAGRLPAEVVRRKKVGFNPPMGVWLNTTLRPLVDTYLSSNTLAEHGLFQAVSVQRLIDEHRNGRRDYTWHLWALLVFEAWRKAYQQ